MQVRQKIRFGTFALSWGRRTDAFFEFLVNRLPIESYVFFLLVKELSAYHNRIHVIGLSSIDQSIDGVLVRSQVRR